MVCVFAGDQFTGPGAFCAGGVCDPQSAERCDEPSQRCVCRQGFSGRLCTSQQGAFTKGFHTDDAASKILTRRQEWAGLFLLVPSIGRHVKFDARPLKICGASVKKSACVNPPSPHTHTHTHTHTQTSETDWAVGWHSPLGVKFSLTLARQKKAPASKNRTPPSLREYPCCCATGRLRRQGTHCACVFNCAHHPVVTTTFTWNLNWGFHADDAASEF